MLQHYCLDLGCSRKFNPLPPPACLRCFLKFTRRTSLRTALMRAKRAHGVCGRFIDGCLCCQKQTAVKLQHLLPGCRLDFLLGWTSEGGGPAAEPQAVSEGVTVGRQVGVRRAPTSAPPSALGELSSRSGGEKARNGGPGVLYADKPPLCFRSSPPGRPPPSLPPTDPIFIFVLCVPPLTTSTFFLKPPHKPW